MESSLKKYPFIFAASACFLSPVVQASLIKKATPQRPNVIVLLADDLGYGDVSCYGQKKINTPNIDRLAKQGVRFTAGYAASATCTPSRYALLTGMYPWRKNVHILPGDAPLIIPTDRPTLATMFKDCGYATGAIGKWHLGLGGKNKDWNKPITPALKEIGFDHSYIMAATNDRVPCVYFSNGKVVNLDSNDPIEISYSKNFEGEPTGQKNPELLKMHPSHHHHQSIVAGVSRIGFMKGGKKARWDDAEMANVFSREALDFIEKNKDASFFLYYGLHQPHVPRVPNKKFEGKSGLGPRGDVILEADAQVGELLDYLKKNNLDKNTIIFFSSDNGPVLDDGYRDFAAQKAKENGYDQNGGFRGGKYSLFEAGTRVPFIVSMPGTLPENVVSDVPVCQLDIFASCAKLVGGKVPEKIDSLETLDVFTNKSDATARKSFVIEAAGRLAYRQDNWVYIPSYKGPAKNTSVNIELGNSKEPLLFDIKKDPFQKENLAKKNIKKFEEMKDAFQKEKNK